MLREKSWACHPAMNYVTCTNVRNISLCLPVYRHRRKWVTQANTPEPVVTPSSPSCFDCSSCRASLLHRCDPCSHLSWVHMAFYMASSLWPLTEWLSLSLQTFLLWEIFQCNSFPAGRFTPSSCQKNSSPYLNRDVQLDCFIGHYSSITQKPYYKV